MQTNKKLKIDISRNQYCYGGNGLWVRDFTKSEVKAKDLNCLIDSSDVSLILNNEMSNEKLSLQNIDTENFEHRYAIIVSNGYGFESVTDKLNNLPEEITVFGVNNILNEWNSSKKVNYYIVNNPYENCVKFFPKSQKIWPRCIASSRTFPDFIKKYQEITGVVYEYSPTLDRYYNGEKNNASYYIDDYRNPICAAIGLCYRFGVKKLILLTCDEASEKEKSGMVKLENGLWMYPQQKIAHDVIDANLYWLKKAKIKVGYHSKVLEYENAEYIDAENMLNFFKQD